MMNSQRVASNGTPSEATAPKEIRPSLNKSLLRPHLLRVALMDVLLDFYDIMFFAAFLQGYPPIMPVK